MVEEEVEVEVAVAARRTCISITTPVSTYLTERRHWVVRLARP